MRLWIEVTCGVVFVWYFFFFVIYDPPFPGPANLLVRAMIPRCEEVSTLFSGRGKTFRQDESLECESGNIALVIRILEFDMADDAREDFEGKASKYRGIASEYHFECSFTDVNIRFPHDIEEPDQYFHYTQEEWDVESPAAPFGGAFFKERVCFRIGPYVTNIVVRRSAPQPDPLNTYWQYRGPAFWLGNDGRDALENAIRLVSQRLHDMVDSLSLSPVERLRPH